MKIDVVAQGRFHAFELARAFVRGGHDVVLLTNYPRSVVERFGFPGARTRSFLAHGLLMRLASRVPLFQREYSESRLHSMFGRWVARSVRKDADLIYGLSSTLEELLDQRTGSVRPLVILCRGSAHIRRQDDLLRDEQKRASAPVPRPTAWMIAREEREYEKADMIAVLSGFAKASFVGRGVLHEKLVMHPLGLDLRRFLADDAALVAREQRIKSRAPLRVLTVGTLSFRKGALDLLAVAQTLKGRIEFRFVGDCPGETSQFVRPDKGMTIVSRVAEAELPQHYAWADLFFFPTIEDGFAAVLLQAAAAGLPILATRNSSAPDFVVEGENGWVVDIRDQAAMLHRLKWCGENRDRLAAMVRPASARASAMSWEAVASRLLLDVEKARRGTPELSRLDDASRRVS